MARAEKQTAFRLYSLQYRLFLIYGLSMVIPADPDRLRETRKSRQERDIRVGDRPASTIDITLSNRLL